MAGRVRQLGPFLGIITSLDERYKSHSYASDARNVRIETGDLQIRSGCQNLLPAQEDFEGCSGLAALSGYGDSYNFVSEYVAFQTVDGVLKPYAIPESGASITEILDGETPLALDAGDWWGFSFNGEGILFRRGGPAYRHAIGDPTSFYAADATEPLAGENAPGVAFTTDENLDGATPGTAYEFTGATAGVLDDSDDPIGNPCLGFTSVDADGNLLLDFDYSAAGEYGFVLDLSDPTAGAADWSADSKLTVKFRIEWTSAGPAKFFNSPLSAGSLTCKITDGAAVTTLVRESAVVHYSFNVGNVPGYTEITLVYAFPADMDAADRDAVESIEFSDILITGNGPHANTVFTVFKLQPSASDAGGATPTMSDSARKVKFGYAYRDSTREAESETVAELATYFWLDKPKRWFADDGDPDAEPDPIPYTFLGNFPTVTVPPSSEAHVNEIAIYVQFEDEAYWRLADTVANDPEADAIAVALDMTAEDFWLLLRRRWKPYVPLGDIVGACPFKGFVAWLKPGGMANVWFSAVGNAFRMPNSYDSITDETRGAKLTLSDNFADQPAWAGQAGDSLIVLGSRGAYASSGNIPSLMTPFKKVPNAKGLYGPLAACRFRNPAGSPGVAYLSSDGELWFVQVADGFNGDEGHYLEELSAGIRGLISRFLLGSSPNASRVHLFADEKGDALWLAYENRALVLRRPSPVDNARQWEAYEYAGAGWSHFSAEDSGQNIRAVRSTGELDEIEHDAAGGRIAGDFGAPVSGWWKSSVLTGVNRRIDRVMAERSDYSAPVDVECISSRQTRTATVPPQRRHVRFGALQQGWEHQFVISFAGTVIYRFTYEEKPCGQRGLA